MSRNVTIHGKNYNQEEQKALNGIPFPETSDLHGFQRGNSDGFSTLLDRKTRVKRKHGPSYRVIDTYVKSKKQYWKERNRRKQVWTLHCEGATYPEIAEKLGISEKTVQRDMKKVSPYYMGVLYRQLRELEEERYREFSKMLDHMTVGQRLKTLTNMILMQRKERYWREYRRHLIKVFINLDDLTDGYPSITPWPQHSNKFTMPMRLEFICVKDGAKESMGTITLS